MKLNPAGTSMYLCFSCRLFVMICYENRIIAYYFALYVSDHRHVHTSCFDVFVVLCPASNLELLHACYLLLKIRCEIYILNYEVCAVSLCGLKFGLFWLPLHAISGESEGCEFSL